MLVGQFSCAMEFQKVYSVCGVERVKVYSLGECKEERLRPYPEH